MLLEMTTHLGPAQVTAVNKGKIMIGLPDGEVSAQLALSFLYEPREGDTVLAIGQEENHYIIGVLKGTGKMTIAAPADLELRATNGALDLYSSRQVRIHSPQVALSTEKLSILADSVKERFGRATRWVKDCFQVQAGRMRTRVKEDHHVQARRIVGLARKDVRLDGEKINLG